MKKERIRSRSGQTWTMTKMTSDEAEDEDFRFWFDEMTPEERVHVIAECWLDYQKTRGIRGIPRFGTVRRCTKRQ